MSDADGGPCKQRFKGVENFLRRIAFNLGNSPSQTEVKIISCIPIDVTDLQQKILDLERLLRRTTKPPAIVHTALCEPGVGNAIDDGPSYINQDQVPETQKVPSYANIDRENPEQNDLQPSPGSSVHSILAEHSSKLRKSFFKKSKKKKALKKKHNKAKSHLVYYVQHTDNSPFKMRIANHVEEKKPKMKKEKARKEPDNSFFTDLIRRQYEPLVYKESGISSPVCRDIEHNYTANASASEICSCCRLNFINLDKNKAEAEYAGFTPNFREQIQNQNMYYDSSLYDLVPVKEAPPKPKKNIDTSKRYQIKNDTNLPYCNYGYKPYVHPMCVNYHTIIPSYPLPHTMPRRSPLHKKRRPVFRRLDVRSVAEATQEDTSNSCRIECGKIYPKPVNKKPEPPKRIEIKARPVTYNNVKTATLQDTECQTTTTTTQNVETSSSPPQDDKTEQTLNQIKTILQSVLTEVKTTKIKPLSEQKVKKDAVVQKGTSFGNMPGSSRLLNSFTYSPYNVAPYAPTYSHPMNPAQPWPGLPYPPKCMHNYPVFIQTPGRHQVYASCFKKPSHVSKAATSRGTSSHATSTQGTTAATNTDERNQNHETETLIKEIYKSMALHIAPKKDTSISNFSSTPKRTSRTSTKSSFCYGTDKSISARPATNNSLPQSLYRRAGPMTSGLTPFTSNMFSNRMTSNTVSVQSHVVSSTDTDRRLRNERLGHYLATTQEMPSEESAARQLMQAERRPQNARELAESSSEESDIEQDQFGAIPQMQKKERNNLFTKMINSVKMFKNRRKKSVKSKLESEEEESDSDDYQTIYSQQTEQARRAPVMQMRRVPHSKVSYSRQMRGRNQDKLRKSAMEQEYRRQWNEQFMYPRQAPASSRNAKGYYEQIYEARPAMVEQSEPVRKATNPDPPGPPAAPVLPVVANRPLVPPSVANQPAVPSVVANRPLMPPVGANWPPIAANRPPIAANRPPIAANRPTMPPKLPPCPKHAHPGAAAAKGLAWFRKRCKCGEHFKSLIVDN